MLRTEQISALTYALKKQGVCPAVALPFTLKYLKAKKRIMETQIFHHEKI
jgi:hypothetical protein